MNATNFVCAHLVEGDAFRCVKVTAAPPNVTYLCESCFGRLATEETGTLMLAPQCDHCMAAMLPLLTVLRTIDYREVSRAFWANQA
jgi:hypothetical protein